MTRIRTARWGNVLLLFCSVTLAGAASEMYLRLFRPQPLDAELVWADGTYRHIPSFTFTYARQEFACRVRYNSAGLRGPEIPSHKRPGVPRVLFIGDSFVEGKQVPERSALTSVMQESAAARGRPIEVINAGVSGAGTGEELILWEKLGRRLEPDVVVLGFFFNDVRNNVDRRYWGLRDGRLASLKHPRPRTGWRNRIRKYLGARSELFALLQMARRSFDDWREPPDPAEVTNEDVLRRDPPARIGTGWDLTIALIDEFRRQVEASGARFLVVVFPAGYQVYDTRWQAMLEQVGLPGEAFDRELPERRIGDWSLASGGAVLTLLEGFRARAGGDPLYYSIDGHWTAAGHALAAELILSEMKRRGLLETGVSRPAGAAAAQPVLPTLTFAARRMVSRSR